MKKLTTIILIICMVFLVTMPALAARRGGGFKSGGFSKPRTTTTSPTTTPTSPSKSTEQPSTKQSTTQQGTGDKIPYTNLNSNKFNQTSGAGTATNIGRSNFSGFRPSFSPFSGNFWMWMFLMNSFGGHSQPAAAQSGDSNPANANNSGVQGDNGLYTPSMGDYWAVDPLANTISTLLLVAAVAIPIMLFRRWRKNRTYYN